MKLIKFLRIIKKRIMIIIFYERLHLLSMMIEALKHNTCFTLY